MKIDVRKRIYDENGNASYELIGLRDIKEETLSMLKNGLIAIKDGNEIDEEDISPIKSNDVGVYLVFNNMEENGDYNIDDEYIPSFEETSSYLRINFCPITGDKFEVIIADEVDVTFEANCFYEVYESSSKKKTRGAKKEASDAYNAYHSFVTSRLSLEELYD